MPSLLKEAGRIFGPCARRYAGSKKARRSFFSRKEPAKPPVWKERSMRESVLSWPKLACRSFLPTLRIPKSSSHGRQDLKASPGHRYLRRTFAFCQAPVLHGHRPPGHGEGFFLGHGAHTIFLVDKIINFAIMVSFSLAQIVSFQVTTENRIKKEEGNFI